MKIFLQDTRTQLYFASQGKWAKASAEAMDFPNYDRAVEFARRNNLSGIQVVLKFPDHPYHICLPFQQPQPGSAPAPG